jgi:hypothetical protein
MAYHPGKRCCAVPNPGSEPRLGARPRLGRVIVIRRYLALKVRYYPGYGGAPRGLSSACRLACSHSRRSTRRARRGLRGRNRSRRCSSSSRVLLQADNSAEIAIKRQCLRATREPAPFTPESFGVEDGCLRRGDRRSYIAVRTRSHAMRGAFVAQKTADGSGTRTVAARGPDGKSLAESAAVKLTARRPEIPGGWPATKEGWRLPFRALCPTPRRDVLFGEAVGRLRATAKGSRLGGGKKPNPRGVLPRSPDGRPFPPPLSWAAQTHRTSGPPRFSAQSPFCVEPT